ncbi:MAG: hypothetical protein K2X39_08635 [Silvanigrellaceae bacterium]|nr:hypothetical protein [Silvanigrellaceae bacterium]
MFIKMSLAALVALAIWSPIASHLQYVKSAKILGLTWAIMGEVLFPDKTSSLGAIRDRDRDPFLDERPPLTRRETRHDFFRD